MKKSATDRDKGRRSFPSDSGPDGYPSVSSTAAMIAACETYGDEYHLPTCGRHIGAAFRLDQLDGERQD